jgi:hypothetical protein
MLSHFSISVPTFCKSNRENLVSGEKRREEKEETYKLPSWQSRILTVPIFKDLPTPLPTSLRELNKLN